MIRIKECPFCGGSVNIVYRSDRNEFQVLHKDPGHSCFEISIKCSEYLASLADAYQVWNTRFNW